MIQKLKEDLLTARKARNTFNSNLLSTVIGEAEMIGKNAGNRVPTEAEVLSVIKKFLKGINDSIIILQKNNRDTTDAIKEKKILEAYLPTQLSEEKLNEIIQQIISATNASSPKEMGKVMGQLKAKYDSQYDGKMASQLVRQLLSK